MAADAYPLVVVESDTVQVSVLQSVKSDTAQVSVLPVAGCKFPAVWGRSPLMWLAWVLACRVSRGLRGNLADMDRRTSPVGSCSPGRNPGGQFGDKDASPRADVAFSSGRVLSWLSTGQM